MPARSPASARVYLLWGQEEVGKRAALAKLLDDLVPPEDRDLDVQYFDAGTPGLTGEAILHAARDRAMFSEHRVVVVLNAGRLRGPRHQRTQAVLAQGLATLPEWSTLILFAYAEDSEERRGRAPFGEELMKALRAGGKVLPFSQLRPEELADLAVREAAAAGKQLTPTAARELAERAGPESQNVVQEVRKLIAYAGDAPQIGPAEVNALVPPAADDNVFHLLDAALSGNQRQAIAILRELEGRGMAPFQLVGHLHRTLRNLAQARLLADHRVPPEAELEDVPPALVQALPESGRFLKSTKAWQRKKLWGQARRFGWDALGRALDRLARLEAGAKGWRQGVEDPRLALELYVADLATGR